jgi:NADH-quinone oxidoreductase subunit N
MTGTEFTALLPFTLLAAMVVVMMLVLAIVRHHLMFFILTLLSLLLTFWGLDYIGKSLLANGQSVAVTPLLLMDQGVVFYSKVIVLACAAVAMQAYRYFRFDNRQEKNVEEFYLLLLLACLGAVVLIASQHFAGFFLGLEIMGVSLFSMIAYPVGVKQTQTLGVHHSIEAAIKYLVLSSIASAFLLLGIAFIYAQTGELSITGLQAYFNSGATLSGLFLPGAMLLLLVGVGFKLSLVPFHWWTPDVYQGAPTPVTALVATVAKGAMVVALVRYFIVTDAYRNQVVWDVLTVVVVASMLVGNLLALTQHNIKRLLAYSSIAHIGYLLVAFIAAADRQTNAALSLGVEAIAMYVVAYFVTTLGAFAVVGAVSDRQEYSNDCYDLRHYRGLFWQRPWITTCFIFMLLSLAGIPLTLGFIGKFYIFAAGAQSHLWGLLLAVVLGSAIGLYYYLRVIIILVQKEAESSRAVTESSWIDSAIIFSLTGVLIVLGIYPAPLISWMPM